MPLQVACPSCSFIVIDDRPPPRCPQCGSRLSCPHCGSVLQRDKDGTGSFVCTRCQARLEGTETGRLTTPERPADDFTPELPGFELRGEIGRGGMGIVYKAWQSSLHREVAVKVLSPALAGKPQFLDRFRNEADLAGKLINAHILPVYDVLETQGVPVIVMPLIVGSDLSRILSHRRSARKGSPPRDPHPWALLGDQAYLDGVLPLLDQLVEAVAALHRAEILHRDIKPSNVLVDRDSHVWLSDFGLARLEAEGLGTQVGVPMGTHGYLSPEQARGEGGIDRRADQFSLAVTIYQALTLNLPYGPRGPDAGPPQPPVPPSRRQPLLPRSLDTVLLKALALDRRDRYATTAEFRDQWRRARSARPERVPWRRQLALAAGLVAVLTLGIAGLRPSLLSSVVPGSPDRDGIVSTAPTPTLARTVYVETEPREAQVVLVPIDPDSGAYLPDRAIRPQMKTPAEVSDVPPGDYLVVARGPAGSFQEVFRRITPPGKSTEESLFRHLRAWERPDGTVGIPRIVIPLNDPSPAMVKFPGGKFTVGCEGMPAASPSQAEVPPFYLDATEVTARDFRLLQGTLPEGMPSDSPDDSPVVWITYDGAVAWAERAGKRLPEESEYEFAATNGGKTRFPWGDAPKFPPWFLGKVREPASDRTQTTVPVYGLYSGVVEWTSSWPYPYSGSLDAATLKASPFPLLLEHVRNSRVTRGGPSSVAAGQPNVGDPKNAFQWDPRWREAFGRETRYPGLGFRCARSAQPRFLQPGNAAQKDKPKFTSGKTTTPDPHP